MASIGAAQPAPKVLPPITEDDVQSMYMIYTNQELNTERLCKNVWYLGYFQGFGEIWARRAIWKSDCIGYTRQAMTRQLIRSQEFQEKALDASLADIKEGLILSTTATYYSQYQNACLLKSRGFQLLNDSCYLHPSYTAAVAMARAHPGTPDGHEHYEHIWWKIQGEPREIGCPIGQPGLNNCGVDARASLDALLEHDSSERRHFLAISWLPRGTLFPNDWKRFYSAADYKLGHNFDAKGPNRKLLSRVQKCPHNFDLSIFKDWVPDFNLGPG